MKLFAPRFYIMLAFFVMTILIIISSCRHKPVIPDSPAISFKNQIQPLFANNCATIGCHDGFTEIDRYYYYNDIISGVTPGNAHQSRLYNRITVLGADGMPPAGPLSEEQIKLFYVWIMQGAKDN